MLGAWSTYSFVKDSLLNPRERSERPIAGSDISPGELFRLWSRANRKDVKAQQKLHKLLVQSPALESHLRAFATDRALARQASAKARGVSLKKVKPISPWGQLLSKAAPYVVVVGGGLPTLGKKR